MLHPAASAQAPSDPRSAALRALLRLGRGEVEHRDAWDAAEDGLAGADAGLARELILGAIIHARLYDALAGRFLRPGPQPPELLIALRLAAHQLFGLDRIPAHAAISTVVEALRRLGCPHLTGVANAVGRRLVGLQLEVRHCDGPLGRLAVADHPASMAVRHGLPDLLVEDLAEVLDEPREARLASLNRRPELCTRTRPGAPPPTGASILRRDGPWTWWGDPQEALRGAVDDGRCVVQDRAQGLVAEAVLATAKAQPGDSVLDLCAAPGGKSLAMLDAGLVVISADLAPRKVADMSDELHRVVADAFQAPFAAGFEIVLVDAPCSNSGVLARRPEARLRYDRRHRDSLLDLQCRLLLAASQMVAPGGRLVYSTCSLVARENQGIAHTLDGWRLLGEHTAWPDGWQAGGYHAVLYRT